jgi:RimJ/RimL family protein N-acetyltransferase
VLVRAWNDAEIAAFNPVPSDPSLAVAARWIAGCDLRRDRHLSLDLVIERQGVVVGEVGLSGFEPTSRSALIGYWLLASARHHGLATDAVRQLTTWSFGVLGLESIVARCHPTNDASHRVAERAGYLLTGTDRDGMQHWTYSESGRGA